jgi:hypothetical protein
MREKFRSSPGKSGAGRRLLSTTLLSLALSGASACSCHAQCVEFSDRAPRADLDTFTKAPSSLFERLRNNKEKLKYVLATYVATDPTVLPSVQTLITEASSSDRTVIGAALRLAEARCTSTKRDAARKIREFVQRVGDLTVTAGYTAAGEDETGVQLPTRDQDAKQPSRGAGLLEGEWKTKIADPFKPLPIPR